MHLKNDSKAHLRDCLKNYLKGYLKGDLMHLRVHLSFASHFI